MRRSALLRAPVTALAAGLLVAGLATLNACTAEQHQLQVFAAASLDEVLTEVARDFEAETGLQVQVSSAGSANLLAQLEQGADADLFIPADEATMQRAADSELLAAEPVVIAANTLVIAVPPGNPAQIEDLQDLSEPENALVMCAPQVPCGAAAHRLAQERGLTLSPVSEELAVTDVLGKVSSAEADAGLVYSTDTLRAGDAVETVEIPEAEEFSNRCPAAVLRSSVRPEQAAQFVEHLRGESGQRTLREAGFIPGDDA